MKQLFTNSSISASPADAQTQVWSDCRDHGFAADESSWHVSTATSAELNSESVNFHGYFYKTVVFVRSALAMLTAPEMPST